MSKEQRKTRGPSSQTTLQCFQPVSWHTEQVSEMSIKGCAKSSHTLKNNGHPQQKGRQRCGEQTRTDVGNEAVGTAPEGPGAEPNVRQQPLHLHRCSRQW